MHQISQFVNNNEKTPIGVFLIKYDYFVALSVCIDR
ncbi:hypothetical protein OAL24_00209 [Oenococcus sicerae]|nr:hypothetical protein OAL24_00209 [Oenococcus sicerae]